jgi:hypothetical protein
VLADTFGEMKECAGGVKEYCFDHASVTFFKNQIA